MSQFDTYEVLPNYNHTHKIYACVHRSLEILKTAKRSEINYAELDKSAVIINFNIKIVIIIIIIIQLTDTHKRARTHAHTS